MWLGIRHSIHEYEEFDVEDKVSISSEVARCTLLYDSAVNKYVPSSPDMYSSAEGILDESKG